ncbi:MAG: LCP family protein [Candidatus Saccharimonadales bacterium]
MDISRYKKPSGNGDWSEALDDFATTDTGPWQSPGSVVGPVKQDPPVVKDKETEVAGVVETEAILVDEVPAEDPPISRLYPSYQKPQRPLRPVKKHHFVRGWVLKSVGLLLIAVLLTGGLLSWKAYGKLHRVFRGTSTIATLSSDKIDPNLLGSEGDSRVNILLLGIGGAGHEGPDLTDTIIIMSVDPVNDSAVMLSVPRDLWVKMPTNFFGSHQKINAAYESGKYSYLGKQVIANNNPGAVEAGFASVDTVIKQTMGVKINYHVLVDFQAFRQAIDTVGGITVNVPKALYDPTMAWENGWNPVLAPAGVQTMDGKKALLYARSRETSSDFARTERQRQIILALKDKTLALGTLSNPVKVDGLLNAFGDNVYSDLSTDGAEQLYNIVKGIDNSQIRSIGLADEPNNYVITDRVGNASVVRPKAGFEDYTDIQSYVRGQMPDGYIVKEKASLVVASGSADTATTDAVAGLLKSYGYDVVSVVTDKHFAGTSRTSIVDLSHGKNPYTRHYLEQHFNASTISKLPPGYQSLSASFKPKFVIIVGQNETATDNN